MSQQLSFRAAHARDGAEIWRLIERMGVLELNSAYAYILHCIHFGDTTLIAERGAELAGFVVAYRPPKQSDTVFVWQIGVAPEVRTRGLGTRLLDELLQLAGCRDVRYLEASVAEDNEPSQKLFRSFARKRGVECVLSPFMPRDMFPSAHSGEDLFRIGPLY